KARKSRSRSTRSSAWCRAPDAAAKRRGGMTGGMTKEKSMARVGLGRLLGLGIAVGALTACAAAPPPASSVAPTPPAATAPPRPAGPAVAPQPTPAPSAAPPTPPQIEPLPEFFESDDFVVVLAKGGDTAESLARRYLGDPAKAWMIEDYNGTAAFTQGREVVIPKRPWNPAGVDPRGYQL